MSLRKSSGNKVCIFPIGGIYVTSDSTNPKDIFGGTWKQLKDMFILACGDTYTNGSTGGEAAHTLTVNEMPKHAHRVVYPNPSGPYETPYIAYPESSEVKKTWGATMFKTELEGNDESHNNMPPYIVKYVWERIS